MILSAEPFQACLYTILFLLSFLPYVSTWVMYPLWKHKKAILIEVSRSHHDMIKGEIDPYIKSKSKKKYANSFKTYE